MSRNTVLVVDDDLELVNVLRLAFERANYTVHSTTSGREGLTLFRAEPPDLVVIDMIIPDRDGIELISDMRRLSPEVKIIAISGHPVLHTLRLLDLALRLGANATLTKPFEASAILRLAEETLATG